MKKTKGEGIRTGSGKESEGWSALLSNQLWRVAAERKRGVSSSRRKRFLKQKNLRLRYFPYTNTKSYLSVCRKQSLSSLLQYGTGSCLTSWVQNDPNAERKRRTRIFRQFFVCDLGNPKKEEVYISLRRHATSDRIACRNLFWYRQRSNRSQIIQSRVSEGTSQREPIWENLHLSRRGVVP